MSKQFIDRNKELSWMQNNSQTGKNLLVLYGRRRVGKTELIKEFSKNKDHIYFLATKKPERDNLRDLQKQMMEYLEDDIFGKIEFEDWEELFEEFFKRIDDHITIAIDEFPYLIEVNKAIPSIFQKIWDEVLKDEKVTLILCGSSIGMMETHVLGYKSPLYGRRTGQWKLKPFNYGQLCEFFPEKNFEDRLKFYSVLDGIPQYLNMMDNKKSAEWNIKNKVMSKGTYLYEEAENLLVQEVRKPANYFSILQAIAEGNTKYGEICNRSGFSKSKVSQYLKNLRELHVIEKEFPVTQTKESRNALYKLTDNYYDFWFEFIYPNKSMLEEGKIEKVLENEKENLKRHFSFVFEDICREYLRSEWDEIGRWWKSGREIDVVGMDKKDKRIIYGECKWSENPVGWSLLNKLKKKSGFVDWKEEEEEFIIFSKSGFEEGLESNEKENIHLMDVDDLEGYFDR